MRKQLIFIAIILITNFVFISLARSENSLIVRVNDYWNNKITFTLEQNDQDNWQTPIDIKNAPYGDCEDFAIAKYLSLIANGIDKERLSLLWVLMDTEDPRLQSHIVLLYRGNKGVYFVLDNYSRQIVPLVQRTDFRRIIAQMNHSGVKLFTPIRNIDIEQKWRQVLLQKNKNIAFLEGKRF